MATTKKVDLNWVHRAAGMCATFQAQDDGRSVEVETTQIVGSIGEGLSLLYIVLVEGIETDEVANGEYWWPFAEYWSVCRDPQGVEVVNEATPEQIAQVA
jgi:hypothetical protein